MNLLLFNSSFLFSHTSKRVYAMKESIFQKELALSLSRIGWPSYSYGKNGFMPLDDKKRFDLLIFIKKQNAFDFNRLSPIALEIKTETNFSTITKALDVQIRSNYAKKKFYCKNQAWMGIPPVFAFCTQPSIEEGVIYKNNFAEASNFYVDRFAWRFGIAVLYRWRGDYWLSHKNCYYNLNKKMEVLARELVFEENGVHRRGDFRDCYDGEGGLNHFCRVSI